MPVPHSLPLTFAVKRLNNYPQERSLASVSVGLGKHRKSRLSLLPNATKTLATHANTSDKYFYSDFFHPSQSVLFIRFVLITSFAIYRQTICRHKIKITKYFFVARIKACLL